MISGSDAEILIIIKARANTVLWTRVMCERRYLYAHNTSVGLFIIYFSNMHSLLAILIPYLLVLNGQT